MISRILTALILVPLIILGILTFNQVTFAVITAIIMFLAAWEWTKLIWIDLVPMRILYIILLAITFTDLYLHLHEEYSKQIIFIILSLGVIWIVCAFISVFSYAIAQRAILTNYWINSLIGFLVLVPCWFAMNTLLMQENGSYYFIYLLFLIWAADTGAYFSGKFLGKKKMIPTVSPGKTWVGLWGGIILAEIISYIAYVLLHPNVSIIVWLLWAFAVVLVSVMGDLFISVMKRQRQVKDSGNLIPGHGGVLDRIDSLTTAVPFFVFVLINLNL